MNVLKGDSSFFSPNNFPRFFHQENPTPKIAKVQVIGADTAFTAVRMDGTVVTWGDEAGGADSSHVQKDLFSVKQVVASFDAFAAVRSSKKFQQTWRSVNFFFGARG